MTRVILFALVFVGVQLGVEETVAQPPAPSGPSMNYNANCVHDWIGEFGGLHQYETRNCPYTGMDGFGQSVDLHSGDQCDSSGCQAVVQTFRKEWKTLTKEGAAKTPCATSLDEAKTIVQNGIDRFEAFDDRYPRAESFWAIWMRKLSQQRLDWKQYLDSGASTEDERLAAFNNHYCSDGLHAAAGILAELDWGERGTRRGVRDWWPLIPGNLSQQDRNHLISFGSGWRIANSRYFTLPNPDGGDDLIFRYVQMSRQSERRYHIFEVDTIAGPVIGGASFVKTHRHQHLIRIFGRNIFATTMTAL